MEKKTPPESFGAFSPVNHVVIAFPSATDLEGAVQDLLRDGLEDPKLVQYTPEQMVAQADRELSQASSVASIGQELNLVRAQRELARKGHCFLVVPAKGREAIDLVARAARAHNAVRAQHYGRLIIEELVEVGTDERQSGESPDRGLDAQTTTGREPLAR